MREVRVVVGPIVKVRQRRPCPIYFEIAFIEADTGITRKPRCSAIIFRNYYCAAITIKQRRGAGLNESWVTVLRSWPLMEDPHFEGDAQNWHVVLTADFEPAYDPSSDQPLRVYLKQPSPSWRTLALEHVKCVAGDLPPLEKIADPTPGAICWLGGLPPADNDEDMTTDVINSGEGEGGEAGSGAGAAKAEAGVASGDGDGDAAPSHIPGNAYRVLAGLRAAAFGRNGAAAATEPQIEQPQGGDNGGPSS